MTKNNVEFDSLISDIKNNKDFNKLNKELHHGITRYDHSMRVAKYTYKIGKLFKMKSIKDTTRAALLHDFYLDSDLKEENKINKLSTHPNMALENSLKYFNLNKMQQDIIKTHMFPCNLSIPQYKESWLVSGVDKIVGMYEMLRYKVSLYIGIYVLFMFEIIKIPR